MELMQHAAHLYHSFTHIQHSLHDAHEEMITTSFHRASETVEFLRLNLESHLAKPRVAIVCGSGLGGLADVVNEGTVKTYDYKDIPNFPQSTGRSDRHMQRKLTVSHSARS